MVTTERTHHEQKLKVKKWCGRKACNAYRIKVIIAIIIVVMTEPKRIRRVCYKTKAEKTSELPVAVQ